MQRIDYSSLPGRYNRPISWTRGCILHKNESNISDEEAPKIAAKIMSSLVECTPARKHLLKYNTKVVCDGITWHLVCAEHEKNPCDICPITLQDFTVALFEDPECKHIFDDLGLKVVI